MELKRRLTIVAPGTSLLDDEEEEEEDIDIAYEDELIYDNEEEEPLAAEVYERYSDEEDPEDISEAVDPLTPHAVPKPTFEELNALYKPKFEEKFTTFQPKARVAEMDTVPKRVVAPEPATASVARKSPPNEPSLKPLEQPKAPSPLVARKSSPLPQDLKPATAIMGHPVEDPENNEYSDEECEEEEEGVSDVDDEDLMRRLEAKYGKLPEHLQAEESDDYSLEGSDIEYAYGDEEELDEEDPSWTSKVK